MIPVDGAGWNAGDLFDAPFDVPCVFVVCVCSFHIILYIWRRHHCYEGMQDLVGCSALTHLEQEWIFIVHLYRFL